MRTAGRVSQVGSPGRARAPPARAMRAGITTVTVNGRTRIARKVRQMAMISIVVELIRAAIWLRESQARIFCSQAHAARMWRLTWLQSHAGRRGESKPEGGAVPLGSSYAGRSEGVAHVLQPHCADKLPLLRYSDARP